MKLVFALLLLCAMGARAQSDLNFDQKLLNCENKWVAITTIDSARYYFGFVYLDNSAGLTIHLEGTFTSRASTYIPEKSKPSKLRLGASTVLVAIIPNAKLADLNVPEKPEWLSYFYVGENDVDRLFRLGCTYNLWGDVAQALSYLNRVKKIDKNYPGLNREYYYAYNGKKRKALAAFYLGEALYDVDEGRQTNCDRYKALVFKQTNANEIKQAEDLYFYAIKECVDESAKADMAFNIAFQYYKLMNKTQLQKWEREVLRWIVPDEPYTEKFSKMKKMLN